MELFTDQELPLMVSVKSELNNDIIVRIKMEKIFWD